MGRPDLISGQLEETTQFCRDASFFYIICQRANGWNDLHEIFRESAE